MAGVNRLRGIPARLGGLCVAVLILWPVPASWGLLGLPLAQWRGGLWLGGAALGICASAMLLPKNAYLPAAEAKRGLNDLPRAKAFRALPGWVMPALCGAAILGIVLKCVLLALPAPGFEACIRLPAIPATAPCERSWEYPSATSYTRIDPVIDVAESTGLGQSSWAISGANATQYNYFTPKQPNRDRLGIAGTWRGSLAEPGAPMQLRYVGEGIVVVDDQRIDLPAAYPAAQTIDLPSGSTIAIDYTWLSEATNADGPQPEPYATLQLLTPDGRPVLAAPTSPAASAAAQITAAIMLITLLAITALVVAFLVQRWGSLRAAVWRSGRDSRRSQRWAWALIGTSSLAILAMGRLQAAVIYPVGIAIVLASLAAIMRGSPRGVFRVLAGIAVTASALAMTMSLTRNDSMVTLRSGGSDPLTYEGQAHALLTSGSLEGGEAVFIYSPAFRYFLAIQHLLVGDQDRAFVALSVAGLLAGAVIACAMLLRPLRADVARIPVLASMVAILLTALLIGSPDVLLGSRTLLSEYPTWIGLLVMVPLVLAGRRGWPLVTAGLLIGVVLTFRGDQLPGLMALLGVALIRQWRSWPGPRPASQTAQRWRWLLATAGAFALPALLPALHNLVFGRQLVLLQTSIPLPVNFPLPPATWPHLLSDPSLQQTLRDQVAGVLVITGVHPEGMTSWLFLVAVRGIQAAAAGLILLAALRGFRGGWRRVLVLALPLAFLLPHVFIQVYVYYPRHIVAGYLVGALALLALAGWSARRSAGRSGIREPISQARP